MYYLRLAFRNLFRHRGRTLITALILAMAVFSFVLGAVITTIACLWPAARAARMEPVDALHHEI